MNKLQETIQQISNQVTEKWSSLTKKQKVQIGVICIAVVLIISMVAYLNRAQMRKLYSEDLDPKYTAEVAQVLDEKKITYKIINDGGNIEVDSKSYSSAVMALSFEGVPNANYTFNDMMSNSMSTTEYEKKLKEHHLTKEDLQITLEQIEGVENAIIQLTIPEEKNSFLQAQQESKASVFLTLSKSLTTKQAEGIASFMAYSVKNLDRKNVIIMDSVGNTLFSGSDEGALALGQQQELKQSAETVIKDKVKDLLGGLYDDVRISPNLVLDFDQYVEAKKEFEAQGEDDQRGVISQESSASASTTNSTTGGEPGTATNGGDTPTYVNGDDTVGSSKENNKDIIYAPNQIETNYVKNQGDIKYDASSVAVSVFKNKLYKEDEIKPTLVGMTWQEFKAQNSEQKALTVDTSIVEAIKNATGIQTVTINGYENPIFLDAEPYTVQNKDLLLIALILIALMAIVLIFVKLRKHDDIVEVEPELEVEEMLKVAKEQVELDEIELKETLETKRQIDKFVDEKPEAVANLLRNWLTEEDWE